MIGVDWVGIAAVIGSVTGLLTVVFGFIITIRTGHIHHEIQTGNGRTIGEAASVAAEAVAPTEPK